MPHFWVYSLQSCNLLPLMIVGFSIQCTKTNFLCLLCLPNGFIILKHWDLHIIAHNWGYFWWPVNLMLKSCPMKQISCCRKQILDLKIFLNVGCLLAFVFVIMPLHLFWLTTSLNRFALDSPPKERQINYLNDFNY